jgi:hypothetical protein
MSVGHGLLFHEGPNGSISARFRRSFAVWKESPMFFIYFKEIFSKESIYYILNV